MKIFLDIESDEEIVPAFPSINELKRRRRKRPRRMPIRDRITMRTFFRHICSPIGVVCIDWMKDKGFIPWMMVCPYCNQEMNFLSNDQALDGYVWSCKGCTVDPSQISIQHGTWFESLKASLYDILLFTYMWTCGSEDSELIREICMDPSTLKEWNEIYTNICCLLYKQNLPEEDQVDTKFLCSRYRESCAAAWRVENRYNNTFIEFLEGANNLSTYIKDFNSVF